MSATVVNVTDVSAVEADMNYLVPMAERPRVYRYEPPAGVPRSNIVYAPHRLPIRNGRQLQPGPSLDREGFSLVAHASAIGDFADEDAIRSVYYPESAEVI